MSPPSDPPLPPPDAPPFGRMSTVAEGARPACFRDISGVIASRERVGNVVESEKEVNGESIFSETKV